MTNDVHDMLPRYNVWTWLIFLWDSPLSNPQVQSNHDTITRQIADECQCALHWIVTLQKQSFFYVFLCFQN